MWYSVHKDNGHLDSVVDHWTFLPGLMIHNGNAPRGTPTLTPGKYRSPLTSGETQTMLQYLWCKLHVIIIWWGRFQWFLFCFIWPLDQVFVDWKINSCTCRFDRVSGIGHRFLHVICCGWLNHEMSLSWPDTKHSCLSQLLLHWQQVKKKKISWILKERHLIFPPLFKKKAILLIF